MSDMNELLQQKLQALEAGASLEQALEGLPAEAEELKPLLRLAAAMQEVAHPEPSPEAIRAGRKAVHTAAVKSVPSPRLVLPRLGWALAPALAGVVALFLCLTVSLVSAGAWFLGPGSARVARLVDVQGHVQISQSADKAAWKTASQGQRLGPGAQIQTLTGSRATLQFRDGSRTTLGPNTAVIITRLEGDWGGVIHVGLEQTMGATSHQVTPFRGKNSSFLVRTPAGIANVWGTRFTVVVDTRGQSFFSVDAGKVLVDNSGDQVSLSAGQGTSALPGQAPDQPAYTFMLTDNLDAAQEGNLTVAGVPVQVTSQTFVESQPEAGAPVVILGRIQPDGAFVADVVQSTSGDLRHFYFTGVIDKIEPAGDPAAPEDQVWTINNVPVLVNEVTELEDTFELGDAVKVVYYVLPDKRWQALSIELLDEEDDEITPTPTETNTPTPLGTGTATPTVTPTMFTDCTGNHQPKADKLAVEHGVTYEEIMGWFCQRFGFGEIDLAYSLSHETGVPVAEIFALRRAGLGWGEIRVRVRYTPTPTATATPTPTPTGDTPTPTPTLTASQTPTSSPTPTQSLTPTITETPTITPTPTVTPTPTITPTPSATSEEARCQEKINPKAVKLAYEHHTTPEIIMGWFCQGFGFGEIDLAYDLSEISGMPVEAVFDLRKSGLGWGQIKNMIGRNKH